MSKRYAFGGGWADEALLWQRGRSSAIFNHSHLTDGLCQWQTWFKFLSKCSLLVAHKRYSSELKMWPMLLRICSAVKNRCLLGSSRLQTGFCVISIPPAKKTEPSNLVLRAQDHKKNPKFKGWQWDLKNPKFKIRSSKERRTKSEITEIVVEKYVFKIPKIQNFRNTRNQ